MFVSHTYQLDVRIRLVPFRLDSLMFSSQCSATDESKPGGSPLVTAANLNNNNFSWTVRAPIGESYPRNLLRLPGSLIRLAGTAVTLSVRDSQGATSSATGVRVMSGGESLRGLGTWALICSLQARAAELTSNTGTMFRCYVRKCTMAMKVAILILQFFAL